MTCLHRLSNSRQNEQTPSASNEMSRAEVSMTHLVQTLGGTVFDEGLIGRMSEYKVLQDRQDRVLERTSAYRCMEVSTWNAVTKLISLHADAHRTTIARWTLETVIWSGNDA